MPNEIENEAQVYGARAGEPAPNNKPSPPDVSEMAPMPWSSEDQFFANDLLIEAGEQTLAIPDNPPPQTNLPAVAPEKTSPAMDTKAAQESPPEKEKAPAAPDKPKRKRAAQTSAKPAQKKKITKAKETEPPPPSPATPTVTPPAPPGIDQLDPYTQQRLDRVSVNRAADIQSAQKQLDSEAVVRAKIHMLQDPAGRHIVAIDQGGITKAYAVADNPGIAARTVNKLKDSIRGIGDRIGDINLLPDVIKTRFRMKNGEQKTVYNVDPEGVDPSHSLMRESGLGENERKNLVVIPVGEPAADQKRVLRSTELPEDVKKRFMHSDNVPGQFFERSNNKLAFIDKGNRLATDQNAPEVIASMISMTQAKGWKSISLKGAEDFRREAWLEASLAGIEVKGYKPSDADLARLDYERQQRMTNAIQPGQPSAPREPNTNEIAPAKPEAPTPIGAEAIALGEVARLKGVREEQLPNFIQAAQAFVNEAHRIGIEVPAMKIYDPKAPAAPTPSQPEPAPKPSHDLNVTQPSVSPKR